MKVNRRPRQPAVHALYINAGLLLAILVALLMRGNGPALTGAAFGAQQMTPIAGGGGIFLMPAQFSSNTWGCYLMDIDTQNICAYQYFPSEKQLRFVAARNYREDRKLGDWNTFPPPAEIAHLNMLGESGVRGSSLPGPDPVSPPSPSSPPFIIVPTTQEHDAPAPEKSGAALPGDPPKPGEAKVYQPIGPAPPGQKPPQ